MGFWSSVWSGIKSVARVVVPFIPDIIEGVKNWIFGTDDIKDAPEYDERSATMDETVKINELLSKKREEYQKITINYEKQMQKVTKSISENLIEGVKKLNSENKLKVNLDLAEKNLKKLIEKIDGLLGKNISIKLTLSDSECAKILQLTGDERSLEIDKYIKKIVNNGIEEFFNELETTFNEILKYQVEHNVNIRLEENEQQLEKLLKEVNIFIRSNDSSEKKKRKLELFKQKEDLEKIVAIMG